MNEEECIKVLINNKKEGKAYMFLPIEVKNWLWDYEEEIVENYVLKEFNPSGEWVRVHTEKDWHSNNGVYCLEKKPGDGWVECEIKQNDCFFINGHYYHWSEWTACLINNNDTLTAFGGWQYADSNTWFMTPRLEIIIANSISYKDSDTIGNYCTTPSAVGCKPAIPVRIRFWKGGTKCNTEK